MNSKEEKLRLLSQLRPRFGFCTGSMNSATSNDGQFQLQKFLLNKSNGVQ